MREKSSSARLPGRSLITHFIPILWDCSTRSRAWARSKRNDWTRSGASCRVPLICPVVAAFAIAVRVLPNFAPTKSHPCRTRSPVIRQPVTFLTSNHGKDRGWRIEDGGSSIEDRKQQFSIVDLLSSRGSDL